MHRWRNKSFAVKLGETSSYLVKLGDHLETSNSGNVSAQQSIVKYSKRRGSNPGSGCLTTSLASVSETVESVAIISKDPTLRHFNKLQVMRDENCNFRSLYILKIYFDQVVETGLFVPTESSLRPAHLATTLNGPLEKEGT